MKDFILRSQRQRAEENYAYEKSKAITLKLCDNPKYIVRESICHNWQFCGKCQKCLIRKGTS